MTHQQANRSPATALISWLKVAAQSVLIWTWRIKLKYQGLRCHSRLGKGTPSRRLVIVAWAFPPAASVGVHVISTLARVAIAERWSVDVICGPAPESPNTAGLEFLESIPREVVIWHVKSRLVDERGSRVHPAKGSVADIDGSYVTALALADCAFQVLRGTRPAAILATGPRFSNFVAARWIAASLGSDLVLHYRDEWSVMTPDFVQSGTADRIAEAKCLCAARLVFFASDEKRKKYCSSFPALDHRRFHVMLNGWDPWFRRASAAQVAMPVDERFTLVYAGRWHRDIQILLNDLSHILSVAEPWAERLTFQFVGDQTPDNKRSLESFRTRFPTSIEALPQMPLTAAVSQMNRASALMLINEHIYNGVIPQKTYDCVATDRPILVYGTTGGAAQIVEELGAGRVVQPGDLAGLANAIQEFMTTDRMRWVTQARSDWTRITNRELIVTETLRLISRHAGVVGDSAPAGAD